MNRKWIILYTDFLHMVNVLQMQFLSLLHSIFSFCALSRSNLSAGLCKVDTVSCFGDRKTLCHQMGCTFFAAVPAKCLNITCLMSSNTIIIPTGGKYITKCKSVDMWLHLVSTFCTLCIPSEWKCIILVNAMCRPLEKCQPYADQLTKSLAYENILTRSVYLVQTIR